MNHEALAKAVKAKKQILLIDIDGVINTQNHNDVHFVKNFPINVDNNVVRFLSDLADSLDNGKLPDLAVFWLTTWCEDAPSLMQDIKRHSRAVHMKSIPQWPSIITRYEIADYMWIGWFKLGVVHKLQQINKDAQIIWVDDELAGDFKAFAKVNEEKITKIAPSASDGLTVDHIQQIKQLIGVAHV